MTTYLKIAITALMGVAIGLAICETRQCRDVRAKTQNLQAQQAPLAEQIGNLHASLATMTNRLAALLAENARLKTNSSETELLKLRSEVTRLRPLQDDVATLQKMLAQSSAGLVEWKTNELADAGCASPIDALKTYIYSAQFDPAKLRNGVVGNDVDPPSEEALQNFIKDKNNHLDMMGGNWELEGYKILSQAWLASDKVRVEIEAVARGGAGISETLTLRKIKGEWKLVVFTNRDTHGAFSHLGFADESNPLPSD